jgi:hypothetical protein
MVKPRACEAVPLVAIRCVPSKRLCNRTIGGARVFEKSLRRGIGRVFAGAVTAPLLDIRYGRGFRKLFLFSLSR